MSINTSLNPSISRVENVNIFLKELCSKKSIAIALIYLGLVSAIFGAISTTGFGAAYANILINTPRIIVLTGISVLAFGFLLLKLSNRTTFDEIKEACVKGNKNLLERYILLGGNVNAKDEKTGFSLMHYAVSSDNASNSLSILKILLNAKADVNAEDNEGRTPLHHAMIKGNAKTANILLKVKNIIVEKKDCNGDTPLHLAVRYSQINCLRRLFEEGLCSVLASFSRLILNKEGKTPYQIALDDNNHEATNLFIEYKLES